MQLQFRVCSSLDVAEGEIRSFSVIGVIIPILVTRQQGKLIAGTSMCPHEEVSLEHGCIRDGAIVCRAHGYRFSLDTGICSHDPKLQWRRYPITLISGDVYVSIA